MASLSCVVGGLPVVSIVWLKNGILISESSDVTISNIANSTLTTGQVTSIITLTNLTLDNAAQYQCVGNNTGAPGVEFTVTSAPATLTVLCKTLIQSHCTDVTLSHSLIRPTLSDC